MSAAAIAAANIAAEDGPAAGVEPALARALADELVGLTALLSDLAFDLASNDATLRQHMHSLQSIDHITQAQLAVADILRSNLDPDARVDAVVLESLAANIRTSLDRYRQTRPDAT